MNKRRLWMLRLLFPFTLVVIFANWFLEQVAEPVINWCWRHTERYLRWCERQLDLAVLEASEDRQP